MHAGRESESILSAGTISVRPSLAPLSRPPDACSPAVRAPLWMVPPVDARAGDNAKPLNPDEVAECAAKRTGVIFACLVDLLQHAMRNDGATAGGEQGAKRQRFDIK